MPKMKIVALAAIASCPYRIAAAAHYMSDSQTCRCFDPAHQEMLEWGYRWDASQERWVRDRPAPVTKGGRHGRKTRRMAGA